MNLRKRSRAVDRPIYEASRPASTGENLDQQMESNGSSCQEIGSDYDETQAPVCKRYKSNNTNSACLRRARSDETMYGLSKSEKDDHDNEENASDLAWWEGASRNMGLDISVRLFKAVAMGAGSQPVESRDTTADDNVTPMKMPSDVHAENRDMRSVMSSILMTNNEKGDESYKCKLCGVTFRDYFDIYIHIRMHGGERSMRALVNQQKTLLDNTPETMTRLKGRPYECLICSRKFKLPKSLLAHVTSIHSTSEDTLIARVPEELLPPGWLHNQSKTAELPQPSVSHSRDSHYHTIQQSLKAMKMLVETDTALLPAAGGSKILQPSHSLAGALAPPPPPASYRQPSTVLRAKPPIRSPYPRSHVPPQGCGTVKLRDSNMVQYKAGEIPLDLSHSQGTLTRRSSTTSVESKDGIMESPIPNRLRNINAHSPEKREIAPQYPAGAKSLLPPGKSMLPSQSMAQHHERQNLSRQHFPLQSQSPDGDHIAEYYPRSSPQRSSIQDPQVSSDTADDKKDALDLIDNAYLQIALERQFNIELDFAELQLRRKYSELGLSSERMKRRRDLQNQPSMSRRELDVHLIKELTRIREMRSSNFDDDLESEDGGYDPYLININEIPSPSLPMDRHPSRNAVSSQNIRHVPSSPPERLQIWRNNMPIWTEKGADPQPPTRRHPRQPIIPQLLSQPPRFQLNPTSQSYKKL